MFAVTRGDGCITLNSLKHWIRHFYRTHLCFMTRVALRLLFLKEPNG